MVAHLYTSGPLSLSIVFDVFVACVRSVGTAAVLACPGVMLARQGVISRDVSRGMSQVSMQVTIPCLLFSSVVPGINARLLRDCWPLIVLPFIYVPIGLGVGWLVVLVTRPHKSFEKGTAAAVAFGNSTGMPIVLLSVIHSALDGPPDVDPMLYLSVYLIFYPVLQWSLGGWMLGVGRPALGSRKSTRELEHAGGKGSERRGSASGAAERESSSYKLAPLPLPPPPPPCNQPADAPPPAAAAGATAAVAAAPTPAQGLASTTRSVRWPTWLGSSAMGAGAKVSVAAPPAPPSERQPLLQAQAPAGGALPAPGARAPLPESADGVGAGSGGGGGGLRQPASSEPAAAAAQAAQQTHSNGAARGGGGGGGSGGVDESRLAPPGLGLGLAPSRSSASIASSAKESSVDGGGEAGGGEGHKRALRAAHATPPRSARWRAPAHKLAAIFAGGRRDASVDSLADAMPYLQAMAEGERFMMDETDDQADGDESGGTDEELPPPVARPRRRTLRERARDCTERATPAYRRAKRATKPVRRVLKQIFKPAVIAVACGIVVGLTPSLKALLLPPASAPFGWLFSGVQRVGGAAVPINLMLLGSTLSKGPSWEQIKMQTNIGVVLAKMVVLPIISIGVVIPFARLVVLPESIRDCFWLVALVVSCTPTANNIVVMCDVAGQNKLAMGTSIFTQYCVAPLLLPGVITVFILIVSSAF